MPHIWEEFLTLLKEEAGNATVETWFKAVSLQHWDPVKKTVYLQAPNKFVSDWIQSNYINLIQTHIGRLLHVNMPRIIVKMPGKNSEQVDGSDCLLSSYQSGDTCLSSSIVPARLARPAQLPRKKLQKRRSSNINSSYSFDSFVVGSNSTLAFSAACAVADQPGASYNPLFIYGRSGLGKTHLLHAIANELRRKHKRISILYQSTDRFVSEFINAIRFDKVHIFNQKYRSTDVLLVDDVQFISNKEQTQEAFFHIFNQLYEMNKQIVFSSDTMPSEIKGLAERLKSRFAWGLVADIQAPSLETKVAILKKKADAQGESLSDEVVYFIASHVFSNIRELEGALVRVMAFSMLTKQSPSIALARRVLGSHKQVRAVNFKQIIKVISKSYSYDFEQIKSKGRCKDLSFVRHLTMFLMRKMTGKSLRAIGECLGGRDHTTVLNGIAKMEIYIENNPHFRDTIRRIESDVQ